MENIVFTQLSIPEVRQIFREEVINVFSSLSENTKNEILSNPLNDNFTTTRRRRGKSQSNNNPSKGGNNG